MIRTTVGYAGGTTRHPTYRRMGDHAETIEIEYDPAQVSYEDLLDVFWASHMPARRALSTQYRSAIFVHDDAQRSVAEESKRRFESAHDAVSTVIEDAGVFTRAEDYHQKHRLRADRELLEDLGSTYPDPRALADSTSAARVNGFLDGYGDSAALAAVVDRLGLGRAGRDRLRSVVDARGQGLTHRVRRL